jgi:hypothetical protein
MLEPLSCASLHAVTDSTRTHHDAVALIRLAKKQQSLLARTVPRSETDRLPTGATATQPDLANDHSTPSYPLSSTNHISSPEPSEPTFYLVVDEFVPVDTFQFRVRMWHQSGYPPLVLYSKVPGEIPPEFYST